MAINVEDLPPWARAQAQRKLEEQERKRKKVSPPLWADKPGGPKYHNQKDQREATDGRSIRFDSRKEARRFDELLALLRAGKIMDLRLQPQFTIQEAYTTPEGERVRAIRYQADFMYKREIQKDRLPVPWELDASGKMWEIVVEDVKSPATKTRVYEMKKKLLRERLGFEITEV